MISSYDKAQRYKGCPLGFNKHVKKPRRAISRAKVLTLFLDGKGATSERNWVLRGKNVEK